MRAPVGFLLLVSTISLAAQAAPLETRSQQHALIVDVLGDARYAVRIIDLKTNETLFSREIIGIPAESIADVRDLHITVRIGQAPYGITTSAEIEKGDTVIDSLHTVWTLTPHRVHLRASGAMRVGGDVKAPVVLKRVEPIYPEEAKKDRISGIVILEVLVDKSGSVKDAVILKDLPEGLADAALTAVKQWLFQPATLNSEPVDAIFNLTIDFRLDGGRSRSAS